jgi:hypothetical protein
MSNVAIETQGDRAHAYIFDASGSGSGVNIRDLAYLEITAILHQHIENASLVDQCQELFSGNHPLGVTPNLDEKSEQAKNTIELILHVRRQALERTTPEIYALMVFDSLMIQLGGLRFTITRNKIHSPLEAAKLCALVSRWLRQVAPEFLKASKI